MAVIGLKESVAATGVDGGDNSGMTPRRRERAYRDWVTPLQARLFDVALAVAVTAVGVAEIWLPFSSRQGDGSAVTGTVVAVLAGAALTLRRRHPLATCVVVLAVWPIAFVLVPMYVLFFGQFVPMAIAMFSVARHGRGRVPFIGAVTGALALLFVDVFVDALRTPGEIVFHWGVFAIVWGFGFGLRRFETKAAESSRRAIAAEVAAAEQAMAAAVAERTRIARELHDIVAHSVSMIVVQAGAAEQVAEDDPAYVRTALANIRATGTGALDDMRRVVAMLRADGETEPLLPQPGLDGLETLVEETRGAGLEVTLEVHGQHRALPPGVDLAAYRIAQEALTNVRRHAEAARVQVLVGYDEDGVRVEVVDDGVGSDAPRSGNGLIGMRERVALYGGHVEAAASPNAGFAVRAFLPTPTGGPETSVPLTRLAPP